MDVYRALANFSADNHASSALSMRKGDLFEVIETVDERTAHDWWGVRRLQDNAVGFVPAKYLKYEERRNRDSSPERDSDEDVTNAGRSGDMDRASDDIPDLYKLPPMEIKPIEEWKSNDIGGSEDVPFPDYSDGEEEDDTELEHSEQRMAKIKNRLDSLLTPEDWEKIVIAADEGVSVPEPDYNDGQDVANGAADRQANGAGFVEPKKLHNPVLASREHQALHKEMLMNQKIGVDVLHRKSELKKELDRRKEAMKIKEREEYHRKKRSSFEEKLEEQANKLKLSEEPAQKAIPEEARPSNEFLRVHSKISRNKSDASTGSS